MITIDEVFAAHEQAKAVYEERFKLFGPGTSDRQRNDAYSRSVKALNLAQFMMDSNITTHVGIEDFCTIRLQRGDTVRLKKGAKVWSTHPQKPNYLNPKVRTLKVWDLDMGWINNSDPIDSRQPTITWVGSGSYWFYASANDIEIIK